MGEFTNEDKGSQEEFMKLEWKEGLEQKSEEH